MSDPETTGLIWHVDAFRLTIPYFNFSSSSLQVRGYYVVVSSHNVSIWNTGSVFSNQSFKSNNLFDLANPIDIQLRNSSYVPLRASFLGLEVLAEVVE